MLKVMFVDKLQSLVKADWDVIRRVKPLVTEWWPETGYRMPKSCCGLLFTDAQVFATNGHWCLMSRIDDPVDDGRVLFYNYINDDVCTDNPFEELPNPVSVGDLRALYYKWQPVNVKVRVEDLLGVVDMVTGIKGKRTTVFRGIVDKVDRNMDIELVKRNGQTLLTAIPVHERKLTKTHLQDGAAFEINLNYLHKILEILEPHYHVLEFCFDNDGSPIVIKAKNPQQGKPVFKIALAQAQLKIREEGEEDESSDESA